MGYLPGMWRDFAVTVAGLAGALVGLLFVAVSIKSDVLARSRSLSSRAAQTLVLFMISAITAVLLVAPQSELALGAELLAVFAVSAAALLILDRRAGHDPGSSVARYIERASPNLVTAVLVGIAGLSFLLKAGGGLYWMIPAKAADADQIYRIIFDGSVAEEHGFVVMGGQADKVTAVLKERYTPTMSLTEAMNLAIAALAGQGDGTNAEPVTGDQLEAALLERSRAHRAFRRLTGPRLDALLADARAALSGAGEAAAAEGTPDGAEPAGEPADRAGGAADGGSGDAAGA